MAHKKFALFLQRVSEATGISSQNDLASALKINRSAITQAKKLNSIPARWLLQLYRTYGLNPDWLVTGTGPRFAKDRYSETDEYVSIPKVQARLSAGGGSFEVGEEVKNHYMFQKDWLKRKGASDKLVMMDIFGNSMEPELREGDTVLIDQSQKDILSGAIYAVGVDDTVMVKRVEKHPNKLVFLSDNKAYATIYLQRDELSSVRIIGKVIWTCPSLK